MIFRNERWGFEHDFEIQIVSLFLTRGSYDVNLKTTNGNHFIISIDCFEGKNISTPITSNSGCINYCGLNISDFREQFNYIKGLIKNNIINIYGERLEVDLKYVPKQPEFNLKT